MILTLGLVVSTTLLLAGVLLTGTDYLRWGILGVILAPPARVLILTIGLLGRRDWVFGGLSLLVLTVLASGALVALRP